MSATSGDDTISVTVDGAVIDGGAGNDSIDIGIYSSVSASGAEGNDTITAGGGTNNTISGNSGDDFIISYGDSAFITGDAPNDTLGGNDTISGVTGSDVTIFGGVGDDSIVSNGNNAYLVGEAGNDTIVLDSLDTAVTVTGAQIFGDDGNDIISVRGADSAEIYGGAGNDSIYVGGNHNQISGDAGNDTIFVEGDDNTLIADSTDTASSTADTLSINGSGNRFLGNSGDNYVLVTAASSSIEITAGGGNDTIVSGGGNDTIAGGSGDDSLVGGSGDDSLAGGDGADVLLGGLGNDTIAPGAGADSIYGGFEGGDWLDYSADTAGVTVMLGGAGTLSGGLAEGDVAYLGILNIENVLGGSGNDLLVGNGGASTTPNTLLGGAGNDTISGGGGEDSLDGGSGDDSLAGGEGDDVIFGDLGNDTLVGGDGNDSINAGSGDDEAFWSAGGGNDTFFGDIGNDTLHLSDWTGPDVSTDTLANGSYGTWTVSGSAVDRLFTDGSATIHAAGFESVVCFASGTMIATVRGELAVEDLRAGDLVVTAGRRAGLQPVQWIGHITARVARHPDRAKVAPVRVKAGALGRGVPFRDLRVSPDHALFLDGHLVPAKYLVNGTSIIQEMWCPAVTYWHVEMPSHTLLVSDGALTESYLDDGNRRHFDNGAIASLFPDFESERANGRYDRDACHPVLRGGEKMEAIRQRIAAIAAVADTAKTRRLA